MASEPRPRALLATALLAGLLAGPAAAAPRDAGAFHADDPRLADLIDRLLHDNPSLLAAVARADAAAARPESAGALPDPELTYRWFARTPETRVGPQEHALELMQALPGPGKRGLDAERAQATADADRSDAEARALSLVAALKRMWYDLAALQETLQVNLEEQRLLERFEEMTRGRYAQGQGSRQGVIRVQTEISRLLETEADLRGRLETHLHHISDLIGSEEHGLGIGPIELELPDPAFDRLELEERWLDVHPRVVAARARVEAAGLEAERRSVENRPNFKVGLGYTFVGRREDPAGIAMPPEDNGKDVLALSVGVSLPLGRDRIRAGVAEATDRRRAGEQELRAARNEVAHAIQEALVRLDALVKRAHLYRDVILPQSAESLAAAEDEYAAGRGGLTEMLEAARTLFRARTMEARLVSDVWIALTDLELATGTRVMPADEPAHSAALLGGTR